MEELKERSVNERRDARLAQVQADHEQAVRILSRLTHHVGPEGLVTNRHPGSDVRHLEISQEKADQIADLLDAFKAWREEAWKW